MAENNFSRFEKSQIMNTAKVLKSFITKKMSIQRKINELEQEIAGIDATQKKWETPIMELLHGHRIEDVIEYKQELTASGKYSTKVVFRYPETILPPVVESSSDAEPVQVTHEDSHTDREPDVDTDMPGSFTDAPEMSESDTNESHDIEESAELAEVIDEEDPFGLD